MDAVTGEVFGVKPKILLAVGETHELPGSGKQNWKIRRCKDSYYSCSCGAWQFAKNSSLRNRSCKHLDTALGAEYEAARLRWETLRTRGSLSAISPSFSSSLQPRGIARHKIKNRVGPCSWSALADEPDYSKVMDAQSWPLPLAEVQRAEYDHFTGLNTFNGRALPKDFKTESAIPMMLSEPWDMKIMDPKGWWMSEKLDGCRAYWTGEQLISRSNRDWKAPEWFLNKLPRSFPLDGELWRERDGFEELSSICGRKDSEGWKTISYFVFDAPGVALPYEERIQAARTKVPDGEMTPDQVLRGEFGGRIATLPMIQCEGKDHLQSYLAEIRRLGGEGVMLRRKNSPYERKRSSHSRKVKAWYDAEAQVVGYTPGEGRHKGQMGSLGLLMECGTIFTCGSGITDAMRKHWMPPKGTIVRYRFHELTQDGWPRFPVYVGVCHDKNSPKDALVSSTSVRADKKARLAKRRCGGFDKIDIGALLAEAPEEGSAKW